MSCENNEDRRVLVLSGPQHWDPRRPITGHLRRYAEHLDPLGIAIVAAYLRDAGFKPVYREMLPGKIWKLRPQIEDSTGVFISSRTFDSDLALETATIAREARKPVVIGGYAPTLMPDYFTGITKVIGEFEPTAERVIEDFKRQKLEETYDAKNLAPHDIYKKYKWPDRNIFTGRGGRLTRVPQEWERGCSNYCSFCSPVVLQKGGKDSSVRVRSVTDIKAEIKSMNIEGGFLFLTDLNTSRIPREVLIELLSFLKEMRIKWFTEGTVMPLLNDLEQYGSLDSLLNLMSPLNGDGGCYSFLYGADDLAAERVAGSRDKETSMIASAVKTFKNFGIPFNLSLVVGLDEHTFPESFFIYRKLLEEVMVSYSFIHLATPYRGTAWGNLVAKDDRFLNQTKSIDFNHRKVVHNPKNMTPDELQQGYYWLLRKVFSIGCGLRSAINNLDTRLFQKDVLLGFLGTGIFWDIETNLAIKELQARGYLNAQKQRMLDYEYQRWIKN